MCERAGLVPQSIQVYAALTLLRTLAEQPQGAAEAARRAGEISERVHDPAGHAAALEATGLVGEAPDAIDALRSARDAWGVLGRPLDVARCELLIGRRLQEQGGAEAVAALEAAAALYEQLGVRHLAIRSRELASV